MQQIIITFPEGTKDLPKIDVETAVEDMLRGLGLDYQEIILK